MIPKSELDKIPYSQRPVSWIATKYPWLKPAGMLEWHALVSSKLPPWDGETPIRWLTTGWACTSKGRQLRNTGRHCVNHTRDTAIKYLCNAWAKSYMYSEPRNIHVRALMLDAEFTFNFKEVSSYGNDEARSAGQD